MDINELDTKVKGSFSKVREDIDSLRKDLETLKNEFLNPNKEINEKLNELLAKKGDKDVFFVSTGNEGVPSNKQQQATTSNNDKQSQAPSLDELKKEVELLFLNLTDREFSAFKAIYDLENEFKEVSYQDLAEYLKIHESWLRGLISNLIKRGIPIIKKRYYNSKVSLSIKKEFRNLNLYEKLIKFRQDIGQRSLFDYK